MQKRNVLFLGLDPATKAALAGAFPREWLEAQELPPSSSEEALQLQLRQNPDLVCCAADPMIYEQLVAVSRHMGKAVPFVVASAQSRPAEWFQAVEGGAADYFGPPFEPGHVRAIFENAVKSPPMTRHFSKVH